MFEQEPMELEVRDNPECGLRLILTFHPSTNFLVPLDRCIALARTALAPGSTPLSQMGSGFKLMVF